MWIIILIISLIFLPVLAWSLLRVEDGPFVIKEKGYKKGKAKGKYKNKLLHGKWIEYYPTGKIKIEGMYKKGEKEEKWTEYYPSGKIMKKVEFLDGKMSGKYIKYGEDGEIIDEKVYYMGYILEEKKTPDVKEIEKVISKEREISPKERKKTGFLTEMKRYQKNFNDIFVTEKKENGQTRFKISPVGIISVLLPYVIKKLWRDE